MCVCGIPRRNATHFPHRESNNTKEKPLSMERYYSFKGVTYLSEETLREKLRHKDIKQWAYIEHDKDKNEDGTQKEPHKHLLVITKANKSIDAMRRIFESEEGNTLFKPIDEIQHDYRYLTHKDDETKYQYESENIKTSSLEYWAKVSKDEDTESRTNEDFINDLEDPTKTRRDLAIKWGRDYMKNFRSYELFVHTMQREEWLKNEIAIEQMQRVDRLNSEWERYRYEQEEYIYDWNEELKYIKDHL